MTDRRRELNRGAGDHRKLVCCYCAMGELTGEELVRWGKETAYFYRRMRCCRCGMRGWSERNKGRRWEIRLLRFEGEARPIHPMVKALSDEAQVEIDAEAEREAKRAKGREARKARDARKALRRASRRRDAGLDA